MSNRSTKGNLIAGSLNVEGNITSASGTLSAPGGVAASTGSAAFLAVTATAGVHMANVTHRIVRLALSAGTTSVRTVNFSLPAGAAIKSIYVDVNTAEATASTKTIDIGFVGGANDLLDGVSTAAAGPVQGSMVAGSVTYGSLLVEGTAASGRFRKDHVVATGTTQLVSQVAEAQTEFAGDLVIEYLAIA